MKTLVVAAVAAALLGAAGCGQSASPSAGSDETPTASAPPTPAATPDSIVTVSAGSICNLLASGTTSPLLDLTNYVSLDTAGESKPDKRAAAEQNLKDLRDIAARAPADLKVNIDAVADETEKLFKVLDGGGTWDATGFKASGYEITQTCSDLGFQ